MNGYTIWRDQEEHPRDCADKQQEIAHPRELPRIIWHGLQAIKVNTYSSDSDLRLFRNFLARHYRHMYRIGIERIIEMHRVNHLRYIQHEIQTLPAMFAVLHTRRVQAEKS